MFDKLEDLRIRLDEILNELQEPDVANDQNRFRKLMKEQNDLTPIVEASIRVQEESGGKYHACRKNSKRKNQKYFLFPFFAHCVSSIR